MRFPSKLFTLKETVIFDCNVIMSEISGEVSLLELYRICKKKCNSVQSFFDALDVLYATKKINYNEETRRVSSVKRDNL